MKLTILGTGNAGVLNCCNTCFMLDDCGKLFLVDTAGGNQIIKQIQDAGYDVLDINDIFITHRHTDHITGIIWILRRLFNAKREIEPVRIYGHREVIDIVRTFARALFPNDIDKLEAKLKFIPVNDGDGYEIIGHKVTFFDIGSTKALQFGFKMELDEGTLTCLGDEPCHENGLKYVKNSTWLMHEAFCLEKESDRYNPHKIHHSTVVDACAFAENEGVKNLILYHTEERNLAVRKELYTAEGRECFTGNLYVPDDLDVIEI